jgi:hypothetical protein
VWVEIKELLLRLASVHGDLAQRIAVHDIVAFAAAAAAAAAAAILGGEGRRELCSLGGAGPQAAMPCSHN